MPPHHYQRARYATGPDLDPDTVIMPCKMAETRKKKQAEAEAENGKHPGMTPKQSRVAEVFFAQEEKERKTFISG